jgi:hypothetical protein
MPGEKLNCCYLLGQFFAFIQNLWRHFEKKGCNLQDFENKKWKIARGSSS